MSDSTSTWTTAELGALIQRIEAGLNVKCEERPPEGGERGLVKISAVTWGRFDEEQSKTLPPSVGVDERSRIRTGDLLLSRANTIELVGASVIVGPITRTLYLSDKVLRLVVDEQFKRWINYAMKTPSMRRSIEEASSGNQLSMRNLSQDKLRALPIPVAPATEQQRIADKLDTVFARVDACRDRLARVAPLLKRFRQSVLAAATTGRLTDDWRSAESKWKPVALDSLCEAVFDGPFGSHLKSDDYVSDGVRVVRLENIGHLHFDASKETFISPEKYAQLERHKLLAGDLLFSSFVDEEVRVCALPANLNTDAINKADCFCLRIDGKACDARFLLYRLACKTTYMKLKEGVHGATRPRINLRQLRQFELGLPPRNEQSEIVRRVETLFAFADRLEARLAQAQTAVDRLTPSLLAKAFRGELVPQDPADEPAAELLKRLARQSPDNGGSSRPGPRRGRRPASVQDTP